MWRSRGKNGQISVHSAEELFPQKYLSFSFPYLGMQQIVLQGSGDYQSQAEIGGKPQGDTEFRGGVGKR